MQERLQKILSRAGIASRRKTEELIAQGRITVNGVTVATLGTKADFETDHIKVDGKLLRSTAPEPIYIALHKPKHVITSTSDPEGRPTVMPYLGRYRSSVYPVGRLDFDSEGLLLLTNDGEFANRVMSAATHLPKTYKVKVSGRLNIEQMNRFREGIRLDGRVTAPAKIHPIKSGANPWYEVELIEGRQNQIRRMFRSLGVLVEKLKRIKIGPVTLGALEPGAFRLLTATELQKIRRFWDPARPPDTLVQSVAKPTRPGARPARSVAKPSRPPDRPARPAAKSNRPAGRPGRPGGKPAHPAAKPSRPGARPSRPAGKLARPGAKPPRPHRKSKRA